MLHPPQSARDHAIVWPIFAASVVAAGAAWWRMDAQPPMLGYSYGV